LKRKSLSRIKSSPTAEVDNSLPNRHGLNPYSLKEDCDNNHKTEEIEKLGKNNRGSHTESQKT
jgi:hypothetical protein